MRPHPRIRKTLKYGGAALTVLLVLVWIGSGWRWWKAGPFSVGDGRLSFGNYDTGLVLGILSGARRIPDVLYLRYEPEGFHWWFSYAGDSRGWLVYIPLWFLAAVSLTITALAFRLDTLARRRARLKLCRNCNYERTGLPPDTVCPECGMPGTTPGRASESQ